MQTKTCSKCSVEQDVAMYHVNRSNKDGLQTLCKTCCKAKMLAWYEKNRDRHNAERRDRHRQARDQISSASRERYRTDPGFRAKKLDNARSYREQHPDLAQKAVQKWCETNPERNAELKRNWTKANPERARLAAQLGQHHRRASLADASPITSELWQSVLDYYGHACAYCFRTAEQTGKALTIDHVVPVSRGGGNDFNNLAPACKPCNNSKSARTPLEFLAKMRRGGPIDCSPRPVLSGPHKYPTA